MLATASPPSAHVNNFDFLRLLFATFVITGHSYYLAGQPEQDTLWLFSHGQEKFSKFGLWGFFAISGYLIVKSLLRSPSLPEYYFKRLIRVFPGLWVMVGLTVLGGYWFFDTRLGSYWQNQQVHLYGLNLVLRLHTSIPGVFAHNPVPGVINGSLWTVPYEVFFYLLLTPLFFLRHRLVWLRAVVLATFSVLLVLQLTGRVYFPTYSLGLIADQLIFLGIFFMAGAVLALFPAWIRQAQWRARLVVVTGLLLLGVLYGGGYTYARFVLIPLFVIALGESNYPVLSWIRRYGDISYGVYIWGWPVQQVLVQVLHPSQPLLALLSVLLAWAVGALSWHLIEKPALQLKWRQVVASTTPAEGVERTRAIPSSSINMTAFPVRPQLVRHPVAQD